MVHRTEQSKADVTARTQQVACNMKCNMRHRISCMLVQSERCTLLGKLYGKYEVEIEMVFVL